MSEEFAGRLLPVLDEIVERFGTPFHVYDETGIDENCRSYLDAFAGTDFREYFAVKGLPNPTLLRLVTRHGFGLDASSPTELEIADRTGVSGDGICFTSNNTSDAELAAALERGAIVTADDLSVLRALARQPVTPGHLALRIHPSAAGTDVESRLGSAESSKFGIVRADVGEAVRLAMATGTARIGLHMMLGSGLMSTEPFLRTLDVLLDVADEIRRDTGVEVASVNLGGGVGVAYHPDEPPFDLAGLGRAATDRLAEWERVTGLRRPRLQMECGRQVTGPHGVLVTRVLHRMHKTRTVIGVDGGMNCLIRPGMYGAYHHVSVHGGEDRPVERADVVGSLCENNDKLAVDRPIPRADVGDLVIAHDTGAHGWSMAFTYNGRLRPQELLLHRDGSVSRVRRAETVDDYLATLDCASDRIRPRPAVPAP
ncbi:diaminopimelate decarboxylase [Pseudonocardia endophytica]|uniref:Diaminopimelate decarboxylase n=1 Tax=Pseudonocardia endophytica TaxID=401976 RepID=A0A4V6NDH8_PSEEN|nr:diaminopimelate decarboxylase [Pseudonocardia endophytica]TCK24586.1 diaminopimelate decarboxylase [Pseudonocardia endophytica]